MSDYKLLTMSFARVYPLYIAKVERKNRSVAEVNEVIFWLTGYSNEQLQAIIKDEIDFETFFYNAPLLNPNRLMITGLICGIRVEEIKEPIIQEIRYLDKLIDELAKGKKMEKILRK